MQSFLGTSLVLSAALLGAGAAAQEQASANGAPVVTPVSATNGWSGVRIVRLSQVRGVVRMDRNTDRGYEAAFANIPVVAGAGLRTGDGLAEVEFEDNSSLRLAPESEIRFPTLARMPTGGTVTTVEVVKGLVYISLEKTKGNSFTLKEGAATTTLGPGAHVRLDAREAAATLAVFEGEATLMMGGTATSLTKHETVEVNPAAQTVAAVVHGTEEGDLDAWDKQGQQYHKVKASFAGSGAGGFGSYGASDLNYYGSFVDMPGCGSMWRPYFANAAWDPFGAGVWAYYPSAGYSWVSPYPWGWLPFHSGEWASCGSAGWGWRPGGSWYGLNNVVMMRLPGRPVPHPLPQPPARNASTLIPVNMKSAAFSGVSSGDRFVFRQNSAGLGVPRTEFGNLRGMSAHVDQHGAVTGNAVMNSVAVPMVSRTGGAMAGVGRSSAMGSAGARSSFAAGAGATHNGGMSGSGASSGMSHMSSSPGVSAGGGAASGAAASSGHH